MERQNIESYTYKYKLLRWKYLLLNHAQRNVIITTEKPTSYGYIFSAGFYFFFFVLPS